MSQGQPSLRGGHRRFLPNSVFGQNLLLIAVLVLVTGLGITAIFRHWVQQPRAQRLMDLVIVDMRSTHEWLLRTPPDLRIEVFARLQHLEDTDMARYSVRHGTPEQVPFVPAESSSSAVRAFVTTLADRLGPDFVVNWQERPTRRLWIAMPIDNTVYWVGLDAQVFVSSFTAVFVAIALGGFLLTLLTATLIQRRISRPLSKISAAALDIGNGSRERLNPRDIPTEIAQVVASFNHMADQLDKTDSDRALMLAGVSHDLRTPLAKLRLGVEILADEGDPDIVSGMIRHIADATVIIEQFINFARPGTEEPLLLTNTNELVSDIVTAIGSPRIGTRLQDIPDHYCRPLALRRAILNLLENALRYASQPALLEAGQQADIWLKTGVDFSTRTVQITVLDSGAGIAPDQIERMRQPFVRNDDARSTIPGAGLGLSIVERIVMLHGGHLTLSSPPSGGLVAIMVIPLADGAEPKKNNSQK